MTHPAGRRYPLAALLELTQETTNRLAARVGIGGRSLHRWRHDGLTERAADRLAVRSGYHPAEVWPDWWEDA